jgi:hypothetical protein
MIETTTSAPVDATATAPIEGAAPAAAEAPKEDPVLSERLSQMARKQKMLYRQQRNYQAREQQIAQREAQIKQFEQFVQSGRQNPEQFLQQTLGMTYDQLTQFKLNGGQVTPEMEVKAIKDDLQRRDQEAQRREQEQAERQRMQSQREQQQVLETWKQEVNDYVESNAEAYELTLKTASQDLITDTVEEHWKRSVANWKRAGSPPGKQPKLMSTKEAADLVEKYLEDQMDEINSTSKKMSSRYARREAEAKDGLKSAAREMRSGSPTLSSQIPTSSAPSLLSVANENDRMQRALAKLKGNG